MEEYIVFSTRRANQLIQRGCNLLRMAPNVKNPKYNVYFLKILQSLEKFMMK